MKRLILFIPLMTFIWGCDDYRYKEGRTPWQTEDKLAFKEQRYRRSRYYSWIKSIN